MRLCYNAELAMHLRTRTFAHPYSWGAFGGLHSASATARHVGHLPAIVGMGK